METRQIHVRDLSTVTGIQQYEHEVQSIYFLGLEDFVGTIYLSIESDDYSNEAIPLANNTFIVGQPMTIYNTTYTCQIYGVLNDGEKIQLSKRFRLIVDKSNNIQGDSEEYPVDPNFTNGIIEFMDEQKERVIQSIPSDYTELESRVDELENSQGGGLTEQAKQALLACFAKVAWIDEDGQSYYDDLYDALYAITGLRVRPTSIRFRQLNDTYQLTATTTPSGRAVTWSSSDTSVATVDSTGLVTSVSDGTATIMAICESLSATCGVTVAQATVTSIDAVYIQSGAVYDTDSLDVLKSDLVVEATYSDSVTERIPSTDYTLSGTLTTGTSTVTVSFGGQTATFTVIVTHELQTFTITNDLLNCSNSNTATAISEGSDYSATLTADSGYRLLDSAIVVRMNGQVIAGAVSNGLVTLNSVSGDIRITATAEEIGYTMFNTIMGTSTYTYNTDNSIYLPDYVGSGKVSTIDELQIEMEIQMQGTVSQLSSVIGAKTTGSNSDINGLQISVYPNNDSSVNVIMYAHCVNTSLIQLIPITVGERCIIKYTNTNSSPSTLTVGQTSVTIPWENNGGCVYPLTLFTTNCNSTNNVQDLKNNRCKMGYLKIWDSNGNLLNHFRPAKRNADNFVGMYDVDNDVFITANTNTRYTVQDWTEAS